MKAWFDRLNPREQLLLGLGAVFVIGAIVFGSLIEPIGQRAEQARARLTAEQDVLDAMRRMAGEARVLQADPGTARRLDPGQSLLSIVNASAAERGIAQAIKRIAPDGSGAVQLVFEQVAFDLLIAWLVDLEEQHGVRVARVTVEQQGMAGFVRTDLVLAGGG